MNTVVMLAVLAAGGSASQRDQGLELGVTRFFLPASGETQVLTQAGVPYLFASAIGSGAAVDRRQDVSDWDPTDGRDAVWESGMRAGRLCRPGEVGGRHTHWRLGRREWCRRWLRCHRRFWCWLHCRGQFRCWLRRHGRFWRWLRRHGRFRGCGGGGRHTRAGAAWLARRGARSGAVPGGALAGRGGAHEGDATRSSRSSSAPMAPQRSHSHRSDVTACALCPFRPMDGGSKPASSPL